MFSAIFGRLKSWVLQWLAGLAIGEIGKFVEADLDPVLEGGGFALRLRVEILDRYTIADVKWQILGEGETNEDLTPEKLNKKFSTRANNLSKEVEAKAVKAAEKMLKEGNAETLDKALQEIRKQSNIDLLKVTNN